MKFHISYILFTLLLMTDLAFSQNSEKAKIVKADALIKKYLIQAKFEKGMTYQAILQFDSLFTPDAKIVFDLPFRDMEKQNTQIKRISKDDRQQYKVISVYGKLVRVSLYIDIIIREMGKESKQISTLDYVISYSGKKDTGNIANDSIIFEVSKQFYDNSWSIASNDNYLVSIRFENGNPLIYNIRRNEEKTTELDLRFTLVDISNDNNKLPGDTASFRIEFEEKINNIELQGTTDFDGKIKFEKKVSKRSKVFLDAVQSKNGIRYEIPNNWKNDGKKVSEQPVDGFTIELTPYKWNGLAYSFLLSGGALIPEEVNMTNFEEGSNFTSDIGYKAGIAFNLTYFFNHTQLMSDRYKWLYGIGSGISVNYQQSEITSNNFNQKRYDYKDNSGDLCQIEYSGNSFSESKDLLSLALPIYFEFRKRTGDKFSFSIRAGANFSMAVSSNYEASGEFSRWGIYDFNSLPIKDDKVHNYFTDSIISFKGNIEYATPMVEGVLKLTGFFNVFKKNPDNSLEIGLEFAMPFTTSNTYGYSESRAQTYNGYWINTENNEYRSLAYATKQIYQYYFGISIGINLIKYKPR